MLVAEVWGKVEGAAVPRELVRKVVVECKMFVEEFERPRITTWVNLSGQGQKAQARSRRKEEETRNILAPSTGGRRTKIRVRAKIF